MFVPIEKMDKSWEMLIMNKVDEVIQLYKDLCNRYDSAKDFFTKEEIHLLIEHEEHLRAEIMELRAKNAKLNKTLKTFPDFFAYEREYEKLKAENAKLRYLLQNALPHIECINIEQSNLITEIGKTLEGETE